MFMTSVLCTVYGAQVYWSYIVGPIAKLCMCQFGPVKIPGGSRKGHC